MTTYLQNGQLLDATGSVVVNGLSNPNWPYNLGLLDSFNRANETPLSTPWSGKSIATGAGSLIGVVSNQAALTGAADNDYLVGPYGPDGGAFATVAILPPTGGYVALYLRGSAFGTSGWGAYYLVWVKGATTDTWDLRKRVAGTITTGLATGGSQSSATIAAGDKIGFGAVGTTLTMYKFTAGAWSAVGNTGTDSAISAGGSIGIELDSTTTRLDDFMGGTK